MTTDKTKLACVLDTLEGFARSKSPVFIGGETGTGKSRIARRVHEMSGRAGAYVEVDCASQTGTLLASALFGHKRGAFTGAAADHRGFFEQAHRGTIFLDEIGEMPLDQQPALLRAVQSGVIRQVGGSKDLSVDVRIVAATNRNLADEVEAGRFRRDLYARLARLPVILPPLRERLDEIPAALPEICRKLDIPEPSAEIVEALCGPCAWPDNWRGVEALVERAHLLKWGADEVRAEMAAMGGAPTPPKTLAPIALPTPRLLSEDRLSIARDLSAARGEIGGWWTAAELALVAGVSRRTANADVTKWLAGGEIQKRGATHSAQYLAQSSRCEILRDSARSKEGEP